MSTPQRAPPEAAAAAAAGVPPLYNTPCRSLLKTGGPPRRIFDHSVGKDLAEAGCFTARGALDHFSLFERVQQLEGERDAMRTRLQELEAGNQRLQELLQQQEEMAAGRCPVPGAAAPGLEAGGGGEQQQRLQERVAQLEEELLVEQQERRKAHNALVDLRGNIRVYCRIKPQAPDQPSALTALPGQSSLTASVHGQEHRFSFSQVFGPQASQRQVFGEVQELVQSCLDGYSVCIMSYGQTGSGKTHTMSGGPGPDDQGLIPRTLAKIMDAVSRLQRQDWVYRLQLSVLEVYNDRLRDLLDPGGREVTDMSAIKHDAGQVSVTGVSQVPIHSADQALQLIARASANRSCHATAMNASSSRSHSVVLLGLSGRHAPSSTSLSGSLAMVDLAGSERLVRSQAEGQRRVEACAINSSLSSLCDVFEALSAAGSGSMRGGGSGAPKHVPYRNSKLTYLLKPCLSAGGKALLLVHVSPEVPSAYESLSSLRFATKVAGVEIGPAQRRIEGGAQQPGAEPSRGLLAPLLSRQSSAPGGAVTSGDGGFRAAPRPKLRPVGPSSGSGSSGSGSGGFQGLPRSRGVQEVQPAGPSAPRATALQTWSWDAGPGDELGPGPQRRPDSWVAAARQGGREERGDAGDEGGVGSGGGEGGDLDVRGYFKRKQQGAEGEGEERGPEGKRGRKAAWH